MSRTPARSPRPSTRPGSKTTSRTPAYKAGADKTIVEGSSAEFAQPAERVFASPLQRAFPLAAINVETLAFGAILLVTLILRLFMLGDRPLHHDESLHATYSWYLMGRANPQYYYDPMMHGPLQFHMIAFFYSIFGSSPFAARLWSVTCGTALVAVPWLLRRQLGRWPTFALMGILALSPTTLYFSRFAREDMQYALFSFLMVAALARYVIDRYAGSPYHFRWLYVLAVSFAMAYAAKESIYLTTAVLGSFIALELSLELAEGNWWLRLGGGVLIGVIGALLLHSTGIAAIGALVIGALLVYLLIVSPQTGPMADAIRRTPWNAWWLSGGIILALLVMLYWPIGAPATWSFVPGAHKVPTTLDLPVAGASKSVPFTYSTDGVIGGLQYWEAQQPVARGGQPWYYYLLVIPLYEWLVVLFGVIGAVYVLRSRRTFTNMLVLWWTVATFLIYGWTSEKMPWNSLHLVVPLAVLAAIGLVVSVQAMRTWVRYLAIAAAVLTGFVSLHNSFTLAYVNGANPVEYYVYVQTSPDVPKVYDELQRLQNHLNTTLHLQVDNEDTWPWAFYLRDPNRWAIDAYPSSASSFGVPTQPALIIGATDYTQLSTSLASTYVAFHENLRWWNPEEYKTYADRTDANGKLLSGIERFKNFLGDAFSRTTWSNILQWEIQRRPFTPTAWDNNGNQLDFYFAVRKEYVQYLSPALQAQAQQQIKTLAAQDPFINLGRQVTWQSTLGPVLQGGQSLQSVSPFAIDAHGDLVVGDQNAHRIVVVAPTGKVIATWGSAGTGPGQFNGKLTPSIGGIAVAPNGNIYATDTWNGRVEEFTPSGSFVRTWGSLNLDAKSPKPDQFYGPRGITVAPNGNLYVTDTGHKRIQVFDSAGKFLFSFGSAGVLPGQFNEPDSVAIAPNGMVYVADFWNQRIQVMDLRGNPISHFAVAAWRFGSYDEPQIAVDAQSRVLVPDGDGSRILVYSATGKPLFAWGGVGSQSGQFSKPLAVAVGPRGLVYVGDVGNVRIQAFKRP